jgi:tryptophan synthase alpha subunit
MQDCARTCRHRPGPTACSCDWVQDPLADGPVIQSASTRALDGGTTLDGVLGMLRGVSGQLTAPVVMFTYYNPIMARTPEVFCRQARDAGASGGRPSLRM